MRQKAIVTGIFFAIMAPVIYLAYMYTAGLDPNKVSITDNGPSYCGPNAEIAAVNLTDFSDLMQQENIKTANYRDMLYRYKGTREFLKLPKSLTKKQAELLIYAYNVAKKDGVNPPMLQGIIWQETKAGGYPGAEVAGDEYGLPPLKRYYGVGQIKLSAAKDVFRKFPKDFPDYYNQETRKFAPVELIIAHLILDDKFNIRVASKYLWILSHNEKRNIIRPKNLTITAYNQGLRRAQDLNVNQWHYTVDVNFYTRTFIRQFNDDNSDFLN